MRAKPFAAVAGLAFAAVSAGNVGKAEEPVSFVRDVAPILVEQCLVCHNGRTAKGRLNVETFRALMKGGASGAAVSPGDGEFSNLVQLVESGEMPRDGDPLSAERVSLLKRWIAGGAKLDEGVAPDRPLPSVIPKAPHPNPPARYPHPMPVTALALRPDGSLLAVSGYHEVLLFDPANGRAVRRLGNLAERVYGLAFSPDGSLLAVAAGTPARMGEVKLFRLGTGEPFIELVSAGDSFLDLAFSADGAKLAAAGADGTVRIWSVNDGSEVTRIDDHADWVTAVAFNPEGDRLATASRDKTAKVFDAETGESLITFAGHERPVSDVLFDPRDPSRVITCGRDRRIRCWNVADAKQEWEHGFDSEILRLAVVHSEAVRGATIVASGTDGEVRLGRSDGSEWKNCESRTDWVQAVAGTSQTGHDVFAIGGQNGLVAIHNSESGEALRVFPAMPLP